MLQEPGISSLEAENNEKKTTDSSTKSTEERSDWTSTEDKFDLSKPSSHWLFNTKPIVSSEKGRIPQ